MTQEEKAKAYDEAIEKAKEINNEHKAQPFDVMLKVFPELVEPNDEKIRKELLAVINDLVLPDEQQSRFITWLEKQGEHANFLSKIQVGDKVTRNEDGVLVNISQLNRVAKKCKKQDGQKPQGKSALEAAKEEKVDNQNCVKPNNRVEPKFKVGDEIKTANEEPLTITKIDEKGYWSEDLFICGFDEECCWDLVEQKSAWSEEDEKFVHGLIRGLSAMRDIHGHITFSSDYIDITETINWLKSLKDRYTWKPSDEYIGMQNEIAQLRAKLRDYGCEL